MTSQLQHPSTVSPGSADATRSSRLPSLTGLRFVAAFLVVLAHTVGFILFKSIDPEAAYAIPAYIGGGLLFAGGNLGVSFFFILSGFILNWVARPKERARDFWRRRFFKIYPNHLVTFAATVVLMVIAGATVTVGNTVPTLFLLQSWIPIESVSHVDGGNTPTWTLSCEILFYLAFPLLIVAVRKIKTHRLWRAVFAVTLAIIAVPCIALLLPATPTMNWDPIPWWRYWFVNHLPFARLLEFVLGLMMAEVVRNGRWVRLKVTPAALLVAVTFVISSMLPDEFDQVAPTALPLALLIAAVAQADISGTRTGMRSRTMVWLGEISYALYLVHFLVVNYGPIGAGYPASFATKTWTLPEAAFDVTVTIAISVLLAWGLYAFVEKPAMRRWSRPRSSSLRDVVKADRTS